MRHPLYAIYGIMVLAFVSFAQYQGWSLTRVNEVKNIPRRYATIRAHTGRTTAATTGTLEAS